ncbi:hypothetical protein P9X50_29055, partial [Bacillus cereus]|nr:hypothetical protein [Bacillus cereus]
LYTLTPKRASLIPYGGKSFIEKLLPQKCEGVRLVAENRCNSKISNIILPTFSKVPKNRIN